MYTFTINASEYDEKNINKAQLQQLINKHKILASRIRRNIRYYEAKHAISSRKRKIAGAPNNKVICNHAKDISDTATGYFMNSAIKYDSHDGNNENFDKLTDAFDIANVDDVDSDNAHDMSVAGVAYEYVYAKKDKAELAVRNLEPDHTFMVYDDTIEQNLLFGVYYYRFKDAITGNYCYRATVGTQNYVYEFIIECSGENHREADIPREHFLGSVPIIEYRNNKFCIGDFEQQISLIDAYDTLMSDRINDKEQFIDALLVVYGALLGEDSDEISEAMKTLRENGLLELPEDARAEYIARTFDENGLETLRNAIKEDIYTFSHVPNLTDENFVGNSSGVAMEYKLLGLDMITKEKEKYYKKGLKRRIELFCNYLNIKAIAINPNLVKITFTRKLPKNMSELAQMIANLKGTVSQGTLIQQLDFVEDAESEIEKVKAENKENIKQQQELFKTGYNSPFDKNNADSEDNEGVEEDDKPKN